MSEPLTGRCACGAVSYTLRRRPRSVVNCHCSMCRRHNGAAFSSYAVIPERFFELQDARGALAGYGYSERVHKHFCRHCGTPLFNTNSRYPQFRMLFLGTLDTPQTLRPTANIFCSSQLDWVRGIDAITSYPEVLGE
ncbi:hypothetical protein EDC39_104139 [Geothermobacter ehrlichii]|uniref:CENP-V/GFA domain-containing protein n=1 Tax=Geothermobacter ehrlichii TaxID=213224 RepID=A0A5D3WL77_9BACT|nr:GFA family protein [Geothermobacter ehrlichii]TYO99015.1 hypothetical protein EDC39_104139 [Geothermobacter ehrlichii]